MLSPQFFPHASTHESNIYLSGPIAGRANDEYDTLFLSANTENDLKLIQLHLFENNSIEAKEGEKLRGGGGGVKIKTESRKQVGTQRKIERERGGGGVERNGEIQSQTGRTGRGRRAVWQILDKNIVRRADIIDKRRRGYRERECVCVCWGGGGGGGGMESKNKEAKKRMWIHVNIITSASLDEHDHSEVALSNVIKKKLRNFETITTLLSLRVISESFLAFSGAV